jgi:hypothetical protein
MHASLKKLADFFKYYFCENRKIDFYENGHVWAIFAKIFANMKFSYFQRIAQPDYNDLFIGSLFASAH